MRFLARRLLQGLGTLVLVSVFSFVLLEIAPGDFFADLRLDPRIPPEALAALRAQWGLDRPLPLRYAAWVRSVAAGELGFSFAYNAPVGPLLLTRAGNTLILTLTATSAAWLLALPLGVWAASGGRFLSRLTSLCTALLLAIPDPLLALGLLLVAVRTGWFPVGGMHSVGVASRGFERSLDLLQHLVLPAFALVLGALPVLLHHVRAALAASLAAPYLQAARGHGLPRRVLLWRHALRASANPLITLLGLSLGMLLSASLVVEVVMGWPGLGPLLLEAILSRDFYLVVGGVLFGAGFLVGGSLLGDLLLYAADPRIRTGA